MINLALPLPEPDGNSALAPLLAQAREYCDAAKSDATRRAYANDWADFSGWCAQHGLNALPADSSTVALWLASLASWAKPATIQRRLAAVRSAHNVAGFSGVTNPCGAAAVRETHKGIRRTLGTAQDKAAPLLIEDLRALCATVNPLTLQGRRDQALLLIGFAGAFRRSELVALAVEDVGWRPEGALLSVRRSKTDQEGAGRQVAISYGRSALCPVTALRGWLEAAEITAGALFRSVDRHGNVGAAGLSDRAVNVVISRACERAGIDADRFSAHSLRAGLCTQAARDGFTETQIARQSGHRSLNVLRGYIREGDAFRGNVTGGLGL